MARGIYKRGKKYSIRYAGVDGRMIYESTGSEKFRDAEALLIRRKQSIQDGKQPEVHRIANYTFGQLAEEYKGWLQGRQASAKVKGYIINTHLLPRFANVPLRRINTVLVDQLQSELIGKGHKNGYTNTVISVFKAMLSQAVNWNMVEQDVLTRVRKVKHLREDNRLKYLTPEEAQRLIDACSPRIRPVVVAAICTGCRKSELLTLRWSNIDMTNGFIHLEKTKNGERRDIPINDTLHFTLVTLPRRLDSPYVFCDPATGKPYRAIHIAFKVACKRAGITDLRFHDLRHSFASFLVMGGADLPTVKQILGHKDIKMTLRYAHLSKAHTSKAVSIIDNALNSTNKTKTIQLGA